MLTRADLLAFIAWARQGRRQTQIYGQAIVELPALLSFLVTRKCHRLKTRR